MLARAAYAIVTAGGQLSPTACTHPISLAPDLARPDVHGLTLWEMISKGRQGRVPHRVEVVMAVTGFLRYPAGSAWVHVCSCAWRTTAARTALVWQHRERSQADIGAAHGGRA